MLCSVTPGTVWTRLGKSSGSGSGPRPALLCNFEEVAGPPLVLVATKWAHRRFEAHELADQVDKIQGSSLNAGAHEITRNPKSGV